MTSGERSCDDGSTSLIGGRRVGKDSMRIEVLGVLDELNCQLGLAAAICSDKQPAEVLGLLQRRLLQLSAVLAEPRPQDERQGGTAALDIAELEQMDLSISASLEPLRSLIVPGGVESAARIHVARAVCRRAERLCVALARAEPIQVDAVAYLNRLGGVLFSLARRANQLAGVADTPWPE